MATEDSEGKKAAVLSVVPKHDLASQLGLSKLEFEYIDALLRTGLYGKTPHDVIMSLIREGFQSAISSGFIALADPSGSSAKKD